MRHTLAGCCALAASGAAEESDKSRRFMSDNGLSPLSLAKQRPQPSVCRP
jgi:hypothetical protein